VILPATPEVGSALLELLDELGGLDLGRLVPPGLVAEAEPPGRIVLGVAVGVLGLSRHAHESRMRSPTRRRAARLELVTLVDCQRDGLELASFEPAGRRGGHRAWRERYVSFDQPEPQQLPRA
jgi:hypothetical protein